jgi:hypothetical protein
MKTIILILSCLFIFFSCQNTFEPKDNTYKSKFEPPLNINGYWCDNSCSNVYFVTQSEIYHTYVGKFWPIKFSTEYSIYDVIIEKTDTNYFIQINNDDYKSYNFILSNDNIKLIIKTNDYLEGIVNLIKITN